MLEFVSIYRPELMGPPPRDANQAFWDPETQTQSPEARRRLQSARACELVRRILETPVPFFQRKLEEAGIKSPADFDGVEDLASIPLTRKQELRSSEAENPPIGDYRFTNLRRCVRIGQSTGTTGTPTTMIFTRKDIWIEYESGARMFWRSGHRPGMMVTHAHPAYLYGGGALLSGTYEYFGLVNLWVPPPDTDALAEQGIRAWMRFKPDIPFVGFSLGRYFEVSAKLGLDPRKDVGLRIPSLGGGGKGMPLMTAGLECYAYIGSPCTQSPGAHLNEDWAVVQAIDPATGQEVPEGQWGNLVVTTLDRDNGMLRYDLEEACALVREPCACGETTIRGFWGGRFKDLLSCQGKRFQASEVEAALRGVRAVSEPSLEWAVVRPQENASQLIVRVEQGDGDVGDAARACASALIEKLGISAKVEMLPRGTLARSGYKTNRVVDA